MQNVGLDESQGEINIGEKTINNLRYADDTTLMTESEEELKSLLMKVKQESEKAGLKLNIQNTKIMASSPTTSQQIDEENMGTVSDFFLLGSKINADADCSTKLKDVPWKDSYDKLSVLKRKDNTLLTKVHTVKAMVFPVVMHACENWTIKKAECQRIDTFGM